MNAPLFLSLAGEPALRHLRASASFTVFAAFARSFYLRSDRGGLVCIGQASLAPGPLMALCWPWYAPADVPPPGTLFERRGTRLAGGERGIDFSRVSSWSPAAVPLPEASLARARLHDLAGLLFSPSGPPPGPFHREKPPPRAPFLSVPQDGLAPLLACILRQNAAVEGTLPAMQALLQREAWAAFRSLRAWLTSDNPEQGGAGLERAVQSLLGLGPGLTPSGDDALSGLLIALSAMGRFAWRDRLGAVTLRLAAEATNTISLAHLEQAALGLGAAPVHEAVRALMGEEGCLLEAVRGLGGVGHSSGWDAFTGIVFTLEALYGEQPDALYRHG